jgi:hypothetical protein
MNNLLKLFIISALSYSCSHAPVDGQPDSSQAPFEINKTNLEIVSSALPRLSKSIFSKSITGVGMANFQAGGALDTVAEALKQEAAKDAHDPQVIATAITKILDAGKLFILTGQRKYGSCHIDYLNISKKSFDQVISELNTIAWRGFDVPTNIEFQSQCAHAAEALYALSHILKSANSK